MPVIDAENKYILQKAIESGIIDIDTLQVQIEEMDRKKYLERHKGKIWQTSDGNYATWINNVENGERKLVKKHTRKEVENKVIDYYKSFDFEPTFCRVYHMWLEEKLGYGEIQHQTYDKYNTTYKRFFKDSELCYKKIMFIDEHMLEHFIKSSIHDNNLTSKGWADLRIILNGVFKYAKRHDYTELSITSFMGDLALSRNIFKKRIVRDEEQIFTEEELKIIFDYIEGKDSSIVELGILLAFQTGMRVGEISALKYSDLVGDVLHVQRTEVKEKEQGHWVFTVRDFTKGRDGYRKVVLTDGAIKTINKVYEKTKDCEWLFSRDGRRIHSKQYTKRLYQLCDKVGIPHRSMHKARKTYATQLLDAGVSSRIVISQMGHTNIETTEMYYHFNNKKVDEIKSILNDSLVI